MIFFSIFTTGESCDSFVTIFYIVVVVVVVAWRVPGVCETKCCGGEHRLLVWGYKEKTNYM